MSYLLDTCILSKLRKLKTNPEPNLQTWINKHPDSAYFVSVLSLGEIQKGISKLGEHNLHHKMVLDDWFSGVLIPWFKDRILPIDFETATIWGNVLGLAQQKGFCLPVIDTLLAATAIQHQLILVTENTKDFIHTEVRLFNPLS